MPPLRYLQLFCLVLVGLAFNGRANHSILVALVCLPISVGLISSPMLRIRFREFFKAQRDRARRYQQQGDVPWKSAFFLAFLPTLLFCLVNGRTVYHFDNLAIQKNAASYVQTGKFEPTQSVLRTGMGMYALTIPILATSWLAGADLSNEQVFWRVSKWNAALIAATVVFLFYLTALNFGFESAALAATVFLYVGSGVLSTLGQALWTHDGVALGLMLCIFLIFVPKRLGEIPRGVLIGLAAFFMASCRTSSFFIVLPLIVWLILYQRKVGLAAAATLLPLFGLLYMSIPDAQFAYINSTKELFVAAYGILLSPGAGLFVYQPWALLLIGWLTMKGKHRMTNSQAHMLLAVCFVQFVLTVMRPNWSGQPCWGTRHLSDVLPILALLVVPVLTHYWGQERFRRITVIAGILALLVQGTGVYGKGMYWSSYPKSQKDSGYEKRVLDWTDPPFLFPLTRVTPPSR